jgi:hypothetical protein
MRLCFALLALMRLASAQPNVLTANYGDERTNANLQETILNTGNVNAAQFGKIGSLPVDGQVYAQPLYAKNVVYVATMHNSVYAFDADAPCATAPLWQVNLGPSLPSSVIGFREISPEIGVLSTPAIDLASNTIYAVAETLENDAPVFRLHALDLSSGAEKMGGPVLIQASGFGGGDGSADGKVALDPWQNLQRTGLLVANGSVYFGFGSVRDRYPYHGWILAYDAGNLNKQRAAFNVTPDGGNGGVWQAGRGLAADGDGNVYAVTGNGDFDGFTNFGEAFVKFAPDLRVLDWFAPADWQDMSDVDADLGSMGPVLVPGTQLVISGDKVNNLYAVNRQNMGHLGTSDAANPQIFQPLSGGGFFNMAVWARDPYPLLYMVEPGDWTGSFRIVDGAVETTPYSQTPVTSDWAFFGVALSANGSTDGSGILWMTAGDHDASYSNPPGKLLAFDAVDLTNLLWSSDGNPDRDYPGGFSKFANPTVVNGMVFVPTFSNAVAVYGLVGSRACRSVGMGVRKGR